MLEFQSGSESLHEYAERGIVAAIQKIKNNFETCSNPEFRLDYHNTLHTQGVLDRTTKILSVLQRHNPQLISEHDIEIGRIAAVFHDIVQDWEPNIIGKPGDPTYKKMRKRFVGRNEEQSANQATDYMEMINQQVGRPVFNQKDIETQREAILATVPHYDSDLGTVTQPNLNANSTLVARSVALADLGFVGMCSGQYFINGEDSLFREDNLDIKEALGYFGNSTKIIGEETKELFRQRMIVWTNGRYGFANGRKALTLQSISLFPTQAQPDLISLFHSFEEILTVSKETAARRSKMNFDELAKDFGYVTQ